ncbi:hypothetical protein GCM10011375_38230 [Hymenobacter qilianensis]|uniref:Uncharacterized protein n=1 Tax=Hymenobacter qilianensis TaxID=1385715 RepID=A0ACB5PWP9_9BACT|nr:hypothetical protein [Hymenobacter qilianensis]GGF79522.1 hypothetical protein GCM10011375_38230 [Hymenobacter qilianensis]
MTAAALTKELHHYPNAEKPLPPAAGSAPPAAGQPRYGRSCPAASAELASLGRSLGRAVIPAS